MRHHPTERASTAATVKLPQLGAGKHRLPLAGKGCGHKYVCVCGYHCRDRARHLPRRRARGRREYLDWQIMTEGFSVTVAFMCWSPSRFRTITAVDSWTQFGAAERSRSDKQTGIRTQPLSEERHTNRKAQHVPYPEQTSAVVQNMATSLIVLWKANQGNSLQLAAAHSQPSTLQVPATYTRTRRTQRNRPCRHPGPSALP